MSICYCSVLPIAQDFAIIFMQFAQNKKSREETCVKNVSSLDFLTLYLSNRYNVLIKACK